MSSRLAIIRDGVVENVIVAPEPDSGWLPPEGSVAIECPNTVGPGWTFQSGAWSRPSVTTAPQGPRVWTALEFDARVESISPGAWERLESTAANPGLPEAYRSQLRAAIRQSAKAQEIVSDDPRTLAFLDAAVSFGVITADERSRILTDP